MLLYENSQNMQFHIQMQNYPKYTDNLSQTR
jgi:hypothetical protein